MGIPKRMGVNSKIAKVWLIWSYPHDLENLQITEKHGEKDLKPLQFEAFTGNMDLPIPRCRWLFPSHDYFTKVTNMTGPWVSA